MPGDQHVAGFKVVAVEQIQGSGFELFAYDQAVQLMRAGLATRMSVSWDDRAIALVGASGEPVAIIVYREQAWLRQVWVNLGAVAESVRRRGLYRRLWELFVEKVRADHPKALTIGSGYDPKNEASAAMHAALNRPVVGYVTEFRL